MNVIRIVLALISCAAVLAPMLGEAVELDEPIRPLPADLKLDPRKVALGGKLFQDMRFAKDDSVACVSCHDFARGGADPRPRSVGFGGAVGGVNSPSVFNSGFNFRQLWSGGASSLEEQVDKVIKNPKVFNSSWDEILRKLRQDAALANDFKATYPDGLTSKNITDAIATYERSLVTPSRFDRYLRGDHQAITSEERKGYDKFKNYGCIACHQGVNVGGNMFQVFGAMGDYFKQRGNLTDADLGRYTVTKRESDRHVFKVPSLRNIELTAPYFHDASAPTLEAAVEVMFKYQLGRTAPTEDKTLIIKFLKTLTGEQLGNGRGSAAERLVEVAQPKAAK
jgi:cytochrome c peroxidase